MAEESDFQPRPGRIRSSPRQRAKPLIAQALAATQRAGGGVSQQGMLKFGCRSTFGRGRVASVRANHLLTGRSRLVTVKARVVRHTARSVPLGAHLGYLRREGVTRDGEKAQLLGPEAEDADPKAFAERCEKDRHHFRFIVSPEDTPPAVSAIAPPYQKHKIAKSLHPNRSPFGESGFRYLRRH